MSDEPSTPRTPDTPPTPTREVNKEAVSMAEQMGGEQKRLISMSLTRMLGIEFETWNLGAKDTPPPLRQRWELEERVKKLHRMTYSPTCSEAGDVPAPFETPASDAHLYTLSADTTDPLNVSPRYTPPPARPAPLTQPRYVDTGFATTPTSQTTDDATPHPKDPKFLPTAMEDTRDNAVDIGHETWQSNPPTILHALKIRQNGTGMKMETGTGGVQARWDRAVGQDGRKENEVSEPFKYKEERHGYEVQHVERRQSHEGDEYQYSNGHEKHRHRHSNDINHEKRRHSKDSNGHEKHRHSNGKHRHSHEKRRHSDDSNGHESIATTINETDIMRMGVSTPCPRGGLSVSTPQPCVPSDYTPSPTHRTISNAAYEVRELPQRKPSKESFSGPLLTGYEARVEEEKKKWEEELMFKRRLAEERKKWEAEHEEELKTLEVPVPVSTPTQTQTPTPVKSAEGIIGGSVMNEGEMQLGAAPPSLPLPDSRAAGDPAEVKDQKDPTKEKNVNEKEDELEEERVNAAAEEEKDEGFVTDDDSDEGVSRPVPLRSCFILPAPLPETRHPSPPPSPQSSVNTSLCSSSASIQECHLDSPDLENTLVQVSASTGGPWLSGKVLSAYSNKIWVTADGWTVPGAFKHLKKV